jgi:hypothetical protein
VPADGGGKRGAKRKDSAEVPAVVVINAHPPRTPHDHIERINRPFADAQVDVSIGSLAENVVFFPLYYKLVLKMYKNIRHQPRTCTFKVDVIEWPQFVSLFRVFGMAMWNAKRLSWYNQQPTTKEQLEKSFLQDRVEAGQATAWNAERICGSRMEFSKWAEQLHEEFVVASHVPRWPLSAPPVFAVFERAFNAEEEHEARQVVAALAKTAT